MGGTYLNIGENKLIEQFLLLIITLHNFTSLKY